MRRDAQTPAALLAARRTSNFLADGIPVIYVDRHPGPAVRGVLSPRILLPMGIDRLLNPREFRAVLIHELAHARRRDNLIRLLYEAALCALWFHPLMWLAMARESPCTANSPAIDGIRHPPRARPRTRLRSRQTRGSGANRRPPSDSLLALERSPGASHCTAAKNTSSRKPAPGITVFRNYRRRHLSNHRSYRLLFRPEALIIPHPAPTQCHFVAVSFAYPTSFVVALP